MAKLRMTYKNLKALRKSKEYQALLVDLVSVGVVPKATAEGLLGYNIPANLITDDKSSGTDNPITDDNGEGSGSGNTVTLLYYATLKGGPKWLTAEYNLTDDTTSEGIITFAKDKFDDDTLNAAFIAEENPEYVEGETSLNNKYIPLNTQPETPEAGMLIVVFVSTNQDTVVAGGN